MSALESMDLASVLIVRGMLVCALIRALVWAVDGALKKLFRALGVWADVVVFLASERPKRARSYATLRNLLRSSEAEARRYQVALEGIEKCCTCTSEEPEDECCCRCGMAREALGRPFVSSMLRYHRGDREALTEIRRHLAEQKGPNT